MKLFIDSNVIIGYCIEIDYWQYYAENLMKNENIYWSTTVKGESEYKLEKLIKTYSNFFNQIKEDLDKEIISKTEFIKLVKSIEYINNKKVPFEQENLANLVWTKGGWLDDVNSIELNENLNLISQGLKKKMYRNYNYCDEMLNLYERQFKAEYIQLVKRLEELKRGNREIHSPDSEILVDCHDLSLSQNLDMGFITSDGDIVYFKKEIKKMTNIKDIIYLKNVHRYT